MKNRTTTSWLFLLFLLARVAVAETFFVHPTGDDNADGTTPRTAFRTILRAAQALNHGDNIVIGPGTYRQSVLIAERFGTPEARITVIGDEDGKKTGIAPGPVVLESSDPDSAALHLSRLANVTLSGLTFRGSGEGLRIDDARDVIVQRCTFEGLSRGLAVSGTANLRVESCLVTRCIIGIRLKSAVDTRLAHLTVAGSTSTGLLVLSSGAGRIRNSLLAQNNTAYIIDDTSAAAWSSDHNVIAGDVGPFGAVPAAHHVYEWFAASNQERHSVHVLPAFVDSQKYDLHIDGAVAWAGGLPGSAVGTPLDPPVEHDRDGKPLRSADGATGAGAFAYPEPQPSRGWTRLDVALETRGPRQSAGIYTEDGSLVRTLLADAAGVRQIWWDGLDDQGNPAPQAKLTLRYVSHDVRVVDDGNFGDNGNPAGTYNPDNPERVVILDDGGFVVTTPYDEAGMPLRRYSSSGQSTFAAALAEKDFVALAAGPDHNLIGVVGKAQQAKLVRLVLPGNRAPFAGGVDSYPICAAGESTSGVMGLAVVEHTAYVALADLNVVRAIDLKTGGKLADYPTPAPIGDIAADENRSLWVISGKEVISLADGKVGQKKFATGLESPRYLAAGVGRLAVVDRLSERIALLDAASGKAIRTWGDPRAPGQWVTLSADVLHDPRGAAFFPDGRLLLTEVARMRILWPQTQRVACSMFSNFMDTAAVHPTQPQYVYCALGVFEVDPKSGAWDWRVESPFYEVQSGEKREKVRLGMPAQAVLLSGKPFIAYHSQGRHLKFFDVTDPLRPRLALEAPHDKIPNWAYGTIAFTRGGDLLMGTHNRTLQFTRVPFAGLDDAGNPQYNWEQLQLLGPSQDPSPRGMSNIAALSADQTSGDVYFLAVTTSNQKMVPGWGADGTGVGKSTVDGSPRWFAPSSGGNYMSISAIHDGKRAIALAAKSFGGQLDLFDSNGLRLTTGNWSWATDYKIGFVDVRYGVQAYVRPDGKIGAYVEDDAIGRLARARVENIESIHEQTVAVAAPGATQPGTPARAELVASDKTLMASGTIPKVAPLPIDGRWEPWQQAGVVPQIVALPASIGFARIVPPELLKDFREGTAIGALAHDGSNLFVCFLVTDETMYFDAAESGIVWQFDGIELWLEEEQFGLSMLRDGTAVMHKFRHHDRSGKEWSANYALPKENIWAKKLDDVTSHPLGRQLAAATSDLSRRPGYLVMGRIPFPEIKLVGGIAGREAKIIDMTGRDGEIIRVGVTIGAISASGREQDYKVNWPAGLMFSDPTRSYPFRLGGK